MSWIHGVSFRGVISGIWDAGVGGRYFHEYSMKVHRLLKHFSYMIHSACSSAPHASDTYVRVNVVSSEERKGDLLQVMEVIE